MAIQCFNSILKFETIYFVNILEASASTHLVVLMNSFGMLPWFYSKVWLYSKKYFGISNIIKIREVI